MSRPFWGTAVSARGRYYLAVFEGRPDAELGRLRGEAYADGHTLGQLDLVALDARLDREEASTNRHVAAVEALTNEIENGPLLEWSRHQPHPPSPATDPEESWTQYCLSVGRWTERPA